MPDHRLPQVLSDDDIASPLWKKIQTHLDERLATLREKNDKPLDERETARLRGQIEEVKALRNLNSRSPIVPNDDAFRD